MYEYDRGGQGEREERKEGRWGGGGEENWRMRGRGEEIYRKATICTWEIKPRQVS